jgi:hypothetical protein
MTKLLQDILAISGAFFMLFKKDKDKQEQISKLTSISSSLENQSEFLNKQNDLLAQQVDIFRNTSILKGQDDGAIEMLRVIEDKKLRLSVKPNIWTNGGIEKGYQKELMIDISNKGENAKLLTYMLTSDDIELYNEYLPFDLDKGNSVYVFARPKTNKHVRDCEYELEVVYSDALGNKYNTKFKGKGAVAKFVTTTEI